MCKISIFIPVYNGELYLQKTIDCILNSSYQNFEALFVDDSSTDSSLEILKAASLKDNRIRVFSKENEGSVPYSWNYVFKHITSPWTLYMSQDDLIHSDLLMNLVKTQELTQADCVIPSCVFFSEDLDIDFRELNKRNDMTHRAKRGVISGRDAFELMFDYEIPGFALWRTEIIKKLGMPTEAFNSDEGMQRIWALNCNRVAFEATPFYYRQRRNSIGSSFKSYQFYSVKTEKKLLQVARQERISAIKIHRAHYKSLFWTLWLYSYLECHKNDFIDERDKIMITLDDAYSFFRKELPMPASKKERALYFVAKHSLLKMLYIKVYSLYLKTKLK